MVFDQMPAAGDRVASLRAMEEVRNFHLTERRGFVFSTILCRRNPDGDVSGLEG